MMEIEDKILTEFKKVLEADKHDFYSQAYKALNHLHPSRVSQILEGTRINTFMHLKQEFLKKALEGKKFQFYYKLQVVQIEDSTSHSISNHKLESIDEYLSQFDLDDSLDGIIAKGYLLQSHSYEILQLTKALK